MAQALPCVSTWCQIAWNPPALGQAPKGRAASHRPTGLASLSLGVAALSRMQYLRNKRHARAGRPNLSGPAVLRQSSAEESGDALIPPMPMGRLVTKGSTTGLEYDPFDAPEFIEDEHGGGIFSWMPVTAEGGLLPEGEYDEQSFEVPADRIEYLQGSGWLQAKGDEDYRAYIVGEVSEAHGRKWQRIILKGRKESVHEGGLRLMAPQLQAGMVFECPTGAAGNLV
ncbi:unnamed protein product [Symbiodinium pilosum]|uniref:Uncharacterized protein n=1 Tax=Symbiodinium pilosum TaxID=2952 RepID=A0A812Y6X9_SYMPI|nr:unnamed protein product [Symbiodinium pilosum]